MLFLNSNFWKLYICILCYHFCSSLLFRSDEFFYAVPGHGTLPIWDFAHLSALTLVPGRQVSFSPFVVLQTIFEGLFFICRAVQFYSVRMNRPSFGACQTLSTWSKYWRSIRNCSLGIWPVRGQPRFRKQFSGGRSSRECQHFQSAGACCRA